MYVQTESRGSLQQGIDCEEHKNHKKASMGCNQRMTTYIYLQRFGLQRLEHVSPNEPIG